MEKDKEIIGLAPPQLDGVSGGEGYPEELHVAAPDVPNGGYLALRSSPGEDDGNELAQIQSGNRFYVDVRRTAAAPCLYYFANYNGIHGWVNASLLVLLD